MRARKLFLEPENRFLSIRNQCELLGIPKSSYYYEPVSASEEDLQIMRKIDELNICHPYYGSRRLSVIISQELGIKVNRKKIQRLMRIMGIEAIYPKPRLTVSNPEHRVYPYLLRELAINRANQVWAADVTYIPMRQGFLYLIVIIDWYSRYVIDFELSNTLEAYFCVSALERALIKGSPEIFNTDQGSQFTSDMWINSLKAHKISISMDGKGRAIDNIIIERFFRSIKYEEIYINPCDTVKQQFNSIKQYIKLYNFKRPHQSLKYKTPAEIYLKGVIL